MKIEGPEIEEYFIKKISTDQFSFVNLSRCYRPEEMDVEQLSIILNGEDFSMGAYEIANRVKPDWKRNDVRFRVFVGGLTNNLFGVYNVNQPDDIVLVRIYGKSSDLFIDRKKERKTFKLLHELGYAPKLYLTFENGMAYEYLPGIPLNNELCQNVKIYPLVARMMAKFHKIKCDENNPFKKLESWKMLDEFIDLMPETYSVPEKELSFRRCCPEGKNELRKELSKLKELLPPLGSPVVFCHNDVIPPNVIYNENTNTVMFIDYEIAGFNYQAYDLALHFTAFADEGGFENPQYPSEEYQLEWIREYLKEFNNCDVVSEDCVRQLYKHVCQFTSVVNLVAAMWSFTQAEVSQIDFDYIKFATDKLKEYRKSLHHLQ